MITLQWEEAAASERLDQLDYIVLQDAVSAHSEISNVVTIFVIFQLMKWFVETKC